MIQLTLFSLVALTGLTLGLIMMHVINTFMNIREFLRKNLNK